MKAKKSVSGGYFSLASFISSLSASLDEMGPQMASEIRKVLNSMPHHGETPMIQRVTVSGGTQPKVQVRLEVPKAVIEDLGAVGPALGAMAGSRGGLGRRPIPDVPPPH